METNNNKYTDLFTAITDEIISNGGEWEDDANLYRSNRHDHV